MKGRKEQYPAWIETIRVLKKYNIDYRTTDNMIVFNLKSINDITIYPRKDHLRFEMKESARNNYETVDKSLYFFKNVGDILNKINPTPFVDIDNIDEFIYQLINPYDNKDKDIIDTAKDIKMNMNSNEDNNPILSKSTKELYLSALASLSKPIDNVIIEAFDELKSTIINTVAPIISEVLSSKFKNMANKLCEISADYFRNMPKLELSPETQKAFKRVSFLMFVNENKWPVFLIDDDGFVDEILSIKNGNSNRTLDEVVFSFIDNDYIDEMFASWMKVENIDDNRVPLLKEALDLYKKQYYYASTALLMCQVDGIAADIFDANILDDSCDEIVNIIKKVYQSARLSGDCDNLDIKKVRKREKLQLIWASGSVEHGMLLWQIIANYMVENIYASGNNADYRNPCRNKICHGEQLNYGTREHALKAILVIDLLVNLMHEHNCMKKMEI